MATHSTLSLALLFAIAAGHPAWAESKDTTGSQFRSMLGFQVSAGVRMANIQKFLGPAETFEAGEFEVAICYYRKETAVMLVSFTGDNDSHAPSTFDMYEIVQTWAGIEKLCAPLPSKIPDTAFQPSGLKLEMNIDQFKGLTGAIAADEIGNGTKSSRVFQKFFSTSHYVFAAFDTRKGLTNFRGQ